MVQIPFSTFSGLDAYIDPASGSILLQVIIAGAVGALGYFFRPIWRFFRMLRRNPAAPPTQLTAPRDAADRPSSPD